MKENTEFHAKQGRPFAVKGKMFARLKYSTIATDVFFAIQRESVSVGMHSTAYGAVSKDFFASAARSGTVVLINHWRSHRDRPE
jgi:hypothetical protein